MGNLSRKQLADALGFKAKSTVQEHIAKGMPTHSVEAAQDWLNKSVNRRVGRTGAQAHAGAKIPPLPAEFDTGASHAPENARNAAFCAGAMPPVESADFDAAMMREDAALVLASRKQVVEAMKSGDAATLNFALGTYAKLSKELVAARLRWMESQAKAARLLDLDECLAAVTPHIAEVRRAFIKLGDRVAAKANPSDPKLAKAVIDEAVDAAFAGFARVEPSLVKAFAAKEDDA